MPKEDPDPDHQINKIINFAQNLRKRIIIPNLQLQNLLNFQYAEINKKTAVFCCAIEKNFVSKSFKRAFRTLTRIQQANYYSKCVKFTLNQLHSINNGQSTQNENSKQTINPDLNPKRNTKRFQQLQVLYKKQGSFKKWAMSKLQIATQLFIVHLQKTDYQLDLNNYILRQSKSKNRQALVLESIEEFAQPQTLRLSNHQKSFQQLKKMLQSYLDKALKKKISRFLKKARSSFSSQFRNSMGLINGVNKNINFNSSGFDFNSNQLVNRPQKPLSVTIQLIIDALEVKSMRSILKDSSSNRISQKQSKKVYKKLIPTQIIQSLNSSKDFQQIQQNLFHNKKQNKTRKIFTFQQDEMDYEWLIKQMNCYKTFKRWKNALFLVNLLAQLPEQKTKIYHQINLYKDYTQVDYVFVRHLFQIQDTYYYIDKSINTEQYGSSTSKVSRGFIQYCLWRFRKINLTNQIQILVEIELKNFKSKNMVQMANQYIGNVYLLKNQYLNSSRANSMGMRTVKNQNFFLFQDESLFNGQNNIKMNNVFRQQSPSFKKTDSRVQLIQQELNAKKEKEKEKQLKLSQQAQNNKKVESQNKQIGKNQSNLVIKNSKLNVKLKQDIQLPEFLKDQNLEKQQNKQSKQMIQQQQLEYYDEKYTHFFSIVDQSDSQSDQIQIQSPLNNQQNQNQNNQLKSIEIKETDQFQDCLQEQPSQQTTNKSQSCIVPLNLRKQNQIKLKTIQNHMHQLPIKPINYLNFKHFINDVPKSSTPLLQKSPIEGTHFLWRNQWKINQKGQLININYEQTKFQSSVLKLVLKKIGKNLLTGKSILNISLPIQIFGTDSNLERLCKGMAYGPKFLEQAAKLDSPLQKMKRVICFALGFGICYIQMQKPFNPILGQTYQGIIDGCPVYGQQTSHHPPISSLLLKGRAYQAYGNFQAKVQMGMNSVSGINEGFMHVLFNQKNKKKTLIKFTCPPGQVSGLVYGQRKLTLTRKSYYIDQQNMIIGIIYWGSQKKKNQLSHNNDYFEGKILKLKQPIDIKKLDKIKQSNCQKILCNIQGRWTGKVIFDDQTLFDVQKQAPYKVEQYKFPLQSNVHYRQDLILRIENKLNEAQDAKQKLQQLQRNDRKLRKKYQKNH